MAMPTQRDGAGKAPRRHDETVTALISVWRRLYPNPDTHQRGDAGARAALRRAPSPDAVLLEPAFHALLLAMKEGGFDFRSFDNDHYRRLALVAALLAERRDGSSGQKRLLQVLGGFDADQRSLSVLRFQSLMAALDRGLDEEAMTALRRALKVAGEATFNIQAFTGDLLGWNERMRIKWTFDYFGRPHVAEPSGLDPAPTHMSAEETAR